MADDQTDPVGQVREGQEQVTYEIARNGKTYSIPGPPGQTREQVIAKIREREGMQAGSAEEMQGSEPDFGTNFLGGATSLPRGAGQLAKETTGLKLGGTSQQTSEGTVPGKKVPMAEADPKSWGYMLGQMTMGGGLAGTAAKAAPFLMNTARGGAILGGVTGLLDPVPNVFPDETYWSQKVGQVESGVGLGFGLTLAGKALPPGASWIVNNLLSKGDVKDRAVQKVLQRIALDNDLGAPSATDMLNLLQVTPKKPMTLADTAAERGAVRGLAGRVARSEGGGAYAKNQLMTRDKAAPERLEGDITRNIWAGASKYRIGQNLMGARRAASTPAYAKLDEIEIVAPTAHLQRLLVNPSVQKGLNWGYALARDEADANNEVFDPHMMGVDVDAEGNVKLSPMPNFRVLDMGKRGLDAMIAAERNETTGQLSVDGRRYLNLKNAYVQQLDAMDSKGVYKAAREAWQGPSHSLDMMKVGESVFERTAEENTDLASKLDPGEKQFVLAGMADAMRLRLSKSGWDSNEARTLLQNPNAQKQIRPFLPTAKDADEFVDAVAREMTMFKTKTELIGGSGTAERLAEDSMSLDPLRAAARVAHHGLKGNIALLLGETVRIYQDIKGKRDPELESALAQILFDPEVANSEMGKRLAAGLKKNQDSKLVNFANMLKAGSGPAASALTAALPSTHPENQ